MAHLTKDTVQLWSKKIPFYWSGPTIYTESARLALLRTKSSLIDKINYNYLYAVCFVFNKHFKNKTRVAVINNHYNSLPKKSQRILYYCKILILRGINFFRNILKYKFKKLSFANNIGVVIEKIRS
jgi:hypothetical protein